MPPALDSRPRKKEKGERRRLYADTPMRQPKLNLTLHRVTPRPHLKEDSTMLRAKRRHKSDLMMHWLTPRPQSKENATVRRARRRMTIKCARYVNILLRQLARCRLAPQSTAIRSNADELQQVAPMTCIRAPRPTSGSLRLRLKSKYQPSPETEHSWGDIA